MVVQRCNEGTWMFLLLYKSTGIPRPYAGANGHISLLRSNEYTGYFSHHLPIINIRSVQIKHRNICTHVYVQITKSLFALLWRTHKNSQQKRTHFIPAIGHCSTPMPPQIGPPLLRSGVLKIIVLARGRERVRKV